MGEPTKPSANAADTWGPPGTFDQFVIERVLGRGGMGHVYLAHDTALDRRVALKFISAADPSSAARGRFLVEARAIARLSHRNVVGVYRIGDVQDRPYIAYEFVAGESLDRIAKPMTWETTLRLAVGLAAGLAAAHAEGILHRDIKPGNAVLSERGEIKLLDFGLAKLAGTPDHADEAAEPVSGDGSTIRQTVTPPSPGRPVVAHVPPRALTHPGTVMGTPAYFAPELWLGDGASPRTDVWALGLVLYELVVGTLPHAHLAGEEMAFAVIDRDFTSVRVARPDVPESFAAIIDRCLRRDATERFPSAVELSKALAEVSAVFLPASGSGTAVQIEPERLAVAASLARMSSQMRTLTASLYARLFEASPESRALFPEDLTAQQDKLAHALRLAIDGLADPERLAPILEDLGRRHVRYAVMPAHFQLLEKALLGALAEVDADSWSPSLERGWKRAYAFIETTMQRGMAEEKKTAVSTPVPRYLADRQTPAEIPRTRYAKSGDVGIAFQVIGEGPIDLVIAPAWLSHVEIAWQHPALAGFLRRLGQVARVIVYDKRGTGMSDRTAPSPTLEERVADLEAVLDAANAKRPVLMGIGQGVATALTFAAQHSARLRGLVLYGASPGGRPSLDADIADIRAQWGAAVFLDREAPSMRKDAAFRRWLALFTRMSATAATAIAMLKLDAQTDLRAELAGVQVPTLVLHRTDDRAVPIDGPRELAAAIAGARFAELPGEDHLPFAGNPEPFATELERFMASLRP